LMTPISSSLQNSERDKPLSHTASSSTVVIPEKVSGVSKQAGLRVEKLRG
jgi:hypothetical protein